MKTMFTLLLTAVLSVLLVAPINVEAQTNCPAPLSLTSSNITNSSAQLAWTVAMTTSFSNLQYRPVGAPNWNTIPVQQIPFTLSNLNCGTAYEWQVQAVCSNSGTTGGVSPFTPGTVFTTLSCNTTCPIPTGLSATNITATGAVLSWNLISPGPGTLFNIRYQSAATGAWTTINNVTSNLYQLGGLACNTVYVFQVQTVCVNSANNTTTLSPWSQLFTFVTAACSNSCPAPTGLSSSNISSTGAVLSWNVIAPNTNAFNLRYRVVGVANFTTVNNATSPYQLGGLLCNMQYEWQVQAVCFSSSGGATLSPWSAPAFFGTSACTGTNCLAPTALTSTNITVNNAVLAWNAVSPAPVAYKLRYRIISSATWTTLNNVTSPYQLGGLVCNGNYEWQVQTVCANTSGTTSLSPWSISAFFTTTACINNCPAPTGLSTTNITAYSALASWNAVPGSPSYFVRYRVFGSTSWNFLIAPSTSALISNLICGTQYQWQVRSMCAPVSNSTLNPFSPIATFTTLACNTNCLAPTALTATNITTNSAQLAWNTTGAPMYRVRYRIPASGMMWIYQTTPATSLVINGLQPASPYEWQVQSVCSPNSSTAGSPWSALAAFQTMQPPVNACPAPTGLVATGVSQQGGLLTWNAVIGAGGYNIRYKPINSTLPYITASSTTNFLQIGNLTPGIVYEWQVQSVCVNSATGVTTLSPWSLISVFTTPLLMNVYPNPADAVVNISLYAEDATLITYELHDMFGKMILNGTYISVSGMNDIEIQTATLREGWYSLSINTTLSSNTSRILISR